MSAAINITGIKFGKLTAIKRSGSNKDKKAVWLCVCECGNEIERTYKSLKKNTELTCGKDHPYKVCTKCKINKHKTEFHKCLDSVNPKCKACVKLFYINNKKKLKEKYYKDMQNPAKKQRKKEVNKKSRIKNKEAQKEQKKIYNKRKSVIERRKKIHQDRKLYDTVYNIKRRLRWRVRDLIKNGDCRKYKSSILLLGCDMPFLKKYLEDKFTKGMNWSKIDKIHIDHIIPCSHFDLTKLEEQKKCFHYTNLQPLWAIDNLRKGSKAITHANKKSSAQLFNEDGCLTFL